MKRIYLDHAASTPVDPEVLRTMEPYLTEIYGNPNSLHSFGQEAMAGVDRARTAIGNAIGASKEEVVFTGSATEANNLALRGVLKAAKTERPKLIVSAVEHESVLDTAKELEEEEVEVVLLPVDKNGAIDLKDLERALDERTVLVSVMYGNNEIGTIEPISEIAEVIKNWKLKIKNSAAVYPLLHSDAVQAFAYLDCDVRKLGVDLMTLSAHKLSGPKGVGALYVRNYEGRITNDESEAENRRKENISHSKLKTQNSKFPLSMVQPLITGGGQEFGLRSGTQNAAGIAGFGKAVALAEKAREKENARLQKLKERFVTGIKEVLPEAELNGPLGVSLPHIANLYLPGISAEDALIRLDMEGVAVSSGAACAARSAKPSHVLRAIGCAPERTASSLRFSFGRTTTDEELTRTLAIMKKLFG